MEGYSLGQVSALTRRKVRYPYTDYMLGRARLASATRQQEADIGLKEKALAQEAEQFTRGQALSREQMEAQAKQAKIGTAIQGAGVAGIGAYLAEKAFPGSLKAIATGGKEYAAAAGEKLKAGYTGVKNYFAREAAAETGAGVTEAGAGAEMGGLGAGNAGLALAAYQGQRMLGKAIGGDVGEILERPATGFGAYSLKQIGKATNIKEIGEAGKFARSAERKLLQEPIDFVGSAVAKGAKKVWKALGI